MLDVKIIQTQNLYNRVVGLKEHWMKKVTSLNYLMMRLEQHDKRMTLYRKEMHICNRKVDEYDKQMEFYNNRLDMLRQLELLRDELKQKRKRQNMEQ
jgi:hypothetical protein